MTEIEKKALALVNAERRKQGLLEPWPYGLAKGVADFKAICRVLKDLEAEKAERAAEREQLETEKAARATEREQHEAFRQEVSDAVEAALSVFNQLVLDDRGESALRGARLVFARFIIPKPDPLVEALDECGFGVSSNAADDIRAALAARGLKIVEDK